MDVSGYPHVKRIFKGQNSKRIFIYYIFQVLGEWTQQRLQERQAAWIS